MDLIKLFSENDKLDGSSNHLPWTIVVKNLLKRDESFDELNFGRTPTENGTYVPDGGAHLTAAEIKKKKVRAVSILAATVKSKFLPTVDKYGDDPAQCWAHFQQRFGGDLLQRQLLFEHRLNTVRMIDGSSVEDYINTINDLAGKLAGMNAEVEEVRLMHIVLRGLPISWGPFVLV